uniref:Putative transport protein n=1 Tax=uncultured Acidobacteriota bacterium TaxID=171953 RepID=Q7X365_9BACT|nr:putative transport protein [uncultured Acidobacteriota bacterium]
MPHPSTRVAFLLTPAVLALTVAACNRGGAAPSGGPAGPPPASVTLLTLQPKPVERASEFIATLRSLRSTTVQPEVEGSVTRIFVKSGDVVRAGMPLVQIDPDRQQAAVRSTEANRSGAAGDVQYWRQQVTRLEALVTAGAVSRLELEQAQNSLKTSEAKLAAIDAQVSEERVQLQYYRVVAPQAGVVGDIPIRVGDRVTQATVITTVDENSSLEAYIQVPVDRAPDLRPGLPVQLLDTDGKPAAVNPISFVAPRVDESTQSVLVKSLLKDVPPRLRAQQFARARIVWSTAPGLTVPVVSVTRLSGQYFCFVAETQDKGLVARQRPVQVGEVVGDDYVVTGGLKAGDRIVVSGIQKLADGVPINAQ